MHILYIDDDAEDREIFREAIETIAPEVVCAFANDGLEGLRSLEESLIMPDFIFVDINMPAMNGKQFLKTIKTLPGLRSIPVFMYSTTTYAGERNEYLRLGAVEVLIKPNTFQEVCQLLQRIIKTTPMASDVLPS